MKFNLLLLFTLTFQFVFSQTTENTVTLTTSGTGKTLEEAKNNALRSAIEQAFGAFISSKTEILNDEIILDEVVSISGGNVLKFEVISELKLANDLYTSTLESVISISKLTTYCESKGVEIEFKGSLFSANLKLQKLNEDAEFIAVKALCETSNILLKNSIDFEVETTEPILVEGKKDIFQIRYNVTCKPNKNYEEFKTYFPTTIKNISMNLDEVESYKKLKKPTYCFVIDNASEMFERDKKGKVIRSYTIGVDTIFLRNINSALAIQNFFIRSNGNLLRFVIKNDIENIYINPCIDNCQSEKYKIAKTKYTSDLNGVDKWILNQDGYSYPYFRFNKLYYENTKFEAYSYYQLFITSRSMLNGYFPLEGDQKWTISSQEIYNYPHVGPELYPYPSSMDIEKFGVLSLNKDFVFRHYIREQYSLEDLGKISFIKVEPLK